MPGQRMSLALEPQSRPLTREDAFALVAQGKTGCLAERNRLTEAYLVELKRQLQLWSEEVDVALQHVWRDEAKAAICRECGDEHEPEHDCDD